MIYQFGGYSLNTDNLTLLHNDVPIEVEPQVFAVLQALIENRDRAISKEELVSLVWKGRVVSDAAISSRIKTARQAIGDDGKSQRLIKTLHSFGFKFVAEVRESHPSPLSGPISANETAADRDDGRASIVVLPLGLNKGAKADEVLAIGITHDIISSLSRLHWLRVIARASAFKLADTQLATQDLHRTFGIDYSLAGFVHFTDGKITLHVQLNDARDDTVLWADSLSGSRDDLHGLRLAVVSKAINLLELQLSDQEAKRAQLANPENLDAWRAYHLATAHLYRFNEADNQAALELFKRSVNLEPGFARGHAGLSAAEFQNAFNRYPGTDAERSEQLALMAAQESIALDPMDPLANFVMGRCHWLSGDPEGSVTWLERAIALNPNYAQGYYAHGLACLMADDALRAYDDATAAETISPLDPFMYGFYGIRAFSYIADGDYESACRWAESAARQPGAIVIMDLVAAAAAELAGRQKRAKSWLQRARRRKPDIDMNYLFQALPFSEGSVKQRLRDALDSLGLDRPHS
ncbi:MAG: winged helix-turn-helix domain-containing protein [Pseudomonadota bacterium]